MSVNERFTTTVKKIGDLRPISELIKSLKSDSQKENENIELKSTLQWDIRQNKENQDLQKSVLKTIAAFLNCDGGVLLIGVEDNGDLFGLAKDIECLKNGSVDKFERYLIQLIENNIGKKFLPYLKIRFEMIDNKDICAVYVQISPFRAFLKWDNKIEFYIRTGGSSKPLNVPDIYDYI